MKQNIETMEVCNMTSENKHRAALDAANETISTLEKEYEHLFKYEKVNEKAMFFAGIFIGAMGAMMFMAIMLSQYGHLWRVVSG